MSLRVRPAVRREGAAWSWPALGVAPYLLVYLFHVLPGPDHPSGWEPTGFVQPDQPSYIAHGRAIFAYGNGLTGPNPYEADPDAPDLYFHWISWIFGVGVGVCGADPGWFFAGFGIVSALVFGRLTMALVDRAGAGSFRVPLTLLALWGGGIAALLGWVDDLGAGWTSGTSGPLRFEPHGGWWMPAWGRNVVYSTEAFYHGLMATSWLLALRGRWLTCLVAIAWTASTHPFTGAQALAIFLGWSVVGRFGSAGGKVPIGFGLGVLGLAALFFGYHFVLLPSHPPHRALQESWALAWSETPFETFATYGPVFALATARWFRDRGRPGRDAGFFATAALASFALSHHHWLAEPRQPLHFTHGYVWMPLYLLGVPILRDGLAWAVRRPSRRVVIGLVGALGCLDNAAWLVHVWRAGEVRGIWLPPGARPAYRAMGSRNLRGTLVCPDVGVGYLAGVYADVMPYVAHMGNTLDYFEKRKAVGAWMEGGGGGPWTDRVAVVLIRDDEPIAEEVERDWDRVYRDDGWSIFVRPGSSGP